MSDSRDYVQIGYRDYKDNLKRIAFFRSPRKTDTLEGTFDFNSDTYINIRVNLTSKVDNGGIFSIQSGDVTVHAIAVDNLTGKVVDHMSGAATKGQVILNMYDPENLRVEGTINGIEGITDFYNMLFNIGFHNEVNKTS